jgi:bacterial leucyl aminopeptidase
MIKPYSRMMPAPFGWTMLIAALAVIPQACGSSSGSQNPVAPTPTPPSSNSVASIAVTGSAPLVGQTAQFSAVASFSDGTTQSVTSVAAWQSSNPAVATVGSSGIVTGVAPGEVDITATYQSQSGRFHSTIATATFSLSGLITDGTSGGVLPGINIRVTSGTNAGALAKTDGAGMYAIGSLAPGAMTVSASAVSYETVEKAVTVSGNTRLDFVLPRTPPAAGPLMATYDSFFKTPSCTAASSSCDSGTLLNGRGPTESHQPNTIFSSCADGTGSAGAFDNGQRIVVRTPDGSPLAAGKSVEILVQWTGIGSSANQIVVWHAPDANQAVWTVLSTLGGSSTSSATVSFTLPSGTLQAIRLGVKFGSGPPCIGSDDDFDDLVFRVQ